MKDKVVFFILGALLATLAYFAGDMSDVKAKNEVVVARQVTVEDGSGSSVSLIVSEGTPGILISNKKNGETVSQIFMVAGSNPSTEYGESAIISLTGRGGEEQVTMYSDGKASIGGDNK
jgi:hypothetical protein